VQKSSYWHSPLLALDFLPSRQFPSARRIETERAAALGDNRWRELLEAFYARVREVLQLYRGREISTAGDGFFATFHGPARAIRCAGAIREAVRALGLDVRCGVHTGECELVGKDLAGIAVHIGARVAALASSGEVLVSYMARCATQRALRPHAAHN
jgi:class 3 adenylate cyclase